MMEKVIRVLTWSIFGLGFIIVVLLALLASLTGRPLYAQQPGGVRSKVKVTLPQADAELLIESKRTKTAGAIREFDTPDMEKGKRYEYEFRTVWKPNAFTTITRTRAVTFTGGDEVIVDLAKDDGKDVVQVALKPMTNDVIDEMIKTAALQKSDVIFEPNMMEGRLLVAGVKAGAKRAVGTQSELAKVKELRESIRIAQKDGSIDVLHTSILDCKDYRDASLVVLYLGEETNLALRPILLRDMNVGSRILSYRFKMGDWKPTRSIKGVNADGEDYELHAWTITDDDKKKYGKK